MKYGNKVLKKCQVCGTEFITRFYRWHELHNRKKYCSKKCSNKGQDKKVECICYWCGKKYKVSPCQKNKTKYCSYKCGCFGSIGPHGYWKDKKRPDLKNTNAVKTMFRKGQMSGDKNPAWRGGITTTNWSFRHTWIYQEWRQKILKRDGFKCVWCGSTINLTVDHIVPFSISEKDRLKISNGRTLCRPCHLLTPTWGGRADKMKGVMSYARE